MTAPPEPIEADDKRRRLERKALRFADIAQCVPDPELRLRWEQLALRAWQESRNCGKMDRR